MTGTPQLVFLDCTKLRLTDRRSSEDLSQLDSDHLQPRAENKTSSSFKPAPVWPHASVWITLSSALELKFNDVTNMTYTLWNMRGNVLPSPKQNRSRLKASSVFSDWKQLLWTPGFSLLRTRSTHSGLKRLYNSESQCWILLWEWRRSRV